MKAVFIGLGYIGLPTAALVAQNGIQVLGVDVNPNVVNTINEGKIHIVEPGLEKIVSQSVNSGRFRASLVPDYADVFFIVVPTPFKDDHVADISYVESATRQVIPYLREGNLFIIESTSPIHTTEKMRDIIYNEKPELIDKIFIAYCPERVLPGNIIYELQNNDRIVGGINVGSSIEAEKFYSLFVKGNIHKTDSKTAEMCKLVENSSRDAQIAFANELSLICDKANINVWELIKLANKHPRVNILQPGCGVGGHCIAVDPWFLVSSFPEEARLIKSSREINDYKSDWCTNKIISTSSEFFNTNKKKPIIACMGLSFKPNIDDLRESPAVHIASRIISETDCSVIIVEPNIDSHPTFNITNYIEAYEKSDIIVWLVKHNEFINIQNDRSKIEIDFCGVRSL